MTSDKEFERLTGWALALAVLLPAMLTATIWLASGPLHIGWRD